MNLGQIVALDNGQSYLKKQSGDLSKAGALLFVPRHTMSPHIKAASNRVLNYFDGVQAAMERGRAVSKAVGSADEIESAMKELIQSARLQGFGLAAKYSGRRMSQTYGKDLTAASKKRAKKVAHFMKGTSKKNLFKEAEQVPDIAEDELPETYTLSVDRAVRAASYEASRAFFKGVRDAVSGTGMKKAWMVTAAHQEDDECDDNEDDGWIDADDVFSSGDFAPPAHLNCPCPMAIR